jgi:hypothetical protein
MYFKESLRAGSEAIQALLPLYKNYNPFKPPVNILRYWVLLLLSYEGAIKPGLLRSPLATTVAYLLTQKDMRGRISQNDVVKTKKCGILRKKNGRLIQPPKMLNSGIAILAKESILGIQNEEWLQESFQ